MLEMFFYLVGTGQDLVADPVVGPRLLGRSGAPGRGRGLHGAQEERLVFTRDEDPEFFSTDPDPAQLEKFSGSDLKSK